MQRLKALALGVASLAAMSGCGLGGETSSDVVISGALYVDFHSDMPCHVRDAPPELSGVTLAFRGEDGTRLGEATTGEIGFELLEFGEGESGWTHPGCRFISPYSATVARAERYEVIFQSTPPNMVGAGSWFTGVADLEPQVISHADLEMQGFGWDFEVSPSYVVGH